MIPKHRIEVGNRSPEINASIEPLDITLSSAITFDTTEMTFDMTKPKRIYYDPRRFQDNDITFDSTKIKF